ncbi:putative secreted protein (Por secretion system target) [Flavobacterium sp. 270]|uniref:RICIN domain-containing protein n=1 Tax=Flavobacterium sp. 270 TaxID=2512114 RepID=UPI0010665CA0|nr:RICIN domain-containing protein [Flavobacterium sp. 270]TDW46639.1 putative secreted protein (Por secretion system target) [Flavobacterium sp. 270]
MKKSTKIFFFLLVLHLFFLNNNWAQLVQISTPAGVVTNNYIRVEGTSSGVEKPMWYEVFSENGKMIDLGAFKQAPNWFFIARHLAAGTNQIKVYGVNSSNNQASASINLIINTSGEPVVRPRPNPAEIWWGGLGANQQLADFPDQWNMVKKYADGYFFHASAWGTENNGLMQNVIQQSAPFGTKFMAELGGGTGTDAGWLQWQHIAWGAGADGWIINRYNSTGLILSEITHDFQPNWRDFATAYPTLNEQQCVDLMTTQWIEYYKKDNIVFPHIKHALTQSPVWWGWNNYPSLNPDTEVDHFTLNGRAYNFNMAMVMENMSAKSKTLPDHKNWAFFSDFPWYTMVWGEDKLTTSGNPGTLGFVAREKQRNYEQWLHDNGNRHIAVCNDDPGGDLMSNPAEWNRQFAAGSMKSIYLQQREGHRPDSFLMESWYFGGTPQRGFPDKVTPESDDNSFTGIAKNAIKYLKGIKDVNGTLETLELSSTPNGNSRTFVLKNTGDVACMPALAAVEEGDEVIVTHWFDSANNDISNFVKSKEGWVYTPLLQPGASISIRCDISQSAGNKKIMLEAFWNPQDPTGIVRVRESWILGQGGIQSPYLGSPWSIPGIVEAENFDNGGEGVAYHDTNLQNITGAYRNEGVDIESSSEGYYNLCFSDTGEWTEYTVNVTQSRNYAIDARVASMAGGNFHLEFNGQNVTGSLVAPNTGGWQNWQWVHKEVYLNSGSYVMRFAIDQPGFNTNGFVFTNLGGGNGIASGQTYRLVNRNSNQVLEIGGCNTADGARAQQWPWLNSVCQKWKVETTDSGYYKLTAQHSNKTLDIVGCSNDIGAGIQQWPWVGGDCEQWSIEPTDNGFYRIISRASGLALEVRDALTTNGAEVRQWSWNTAACQQWKLEPISSTAKSSLKTEELTAVEDSAETVRLYPNPANDKVKLLFPQNEGEFATIQITDLLGNTQISIKGVTDGETSLDISKLNAGIYIVSISNGTTITNKKLVVKK